VHFGHLANTLLKEEEGAKDDRSSALLLSPLQAGDGDRQRRAPGSNCAAAQGGSTALSMQQMRAVPC